MPSRKKSNGSPGQLSQSTCRLQSRKPASPLYEENDDDALFWPSDSLMQHVVAATNSEENLKEDILFQLMNLNLSVRSASRNSRPLLNPRPFGGCENAAQANNACSKTMQSPSSNAPTSSISSLGSPSPPLLRRIAHVQSQELVGRCGSMSVLEMQRKHSIAGEEGDDLFMCNSDMSDVCGDRRNSCDSNSKSFLFAKAVKASSAPEIGGCEDDVDSDDGNMLYCSDRLSSSLACPLLNWDDDSSFESCSSNSLSSSSSNSPVPQEIPSFLQNLPKKLRDDIIVQDHHLEVMVEYRKLRDTIATHLRRSRGRRMRKQSAFDRRMKLQAIDSNWGKRWAAESSASDTKPDTPMS